MRAWVTAAARRVLIATIMIAGATLLNTVAQANAVTAGFVFLISVLLLTVWQGFIAGMLGSILSTACFNYFFFPPFGTFHIADPQNWVSLACFLAATMIASRLVSRERERAYEAESREREIEALYKLCLELFTAGPAPGGLDAATRRALATIGARGGGLELHPATPGTDRETWIGSQRDLEMHRLLHSAVDDPRDARGKVWRNVRIPIILGGARVGDVVAYGTRANRETLESVARLIALALERERLLEERARLEALRQSDSLKTALLQAVSHDLSTPLTAVRVSIESLRRTLAREPEASETIEVIATETSRLHRRIQNLLDLARLQAGSTRPHREPTPAADLFRSTRENLPYIVSIRRVESRVEAGCPDLDVDPSLALEILVNLVENADSASPPAAAIELVARIDSADPDRVLVEVLDRGRGFTAPGTRDVARAEETSQLLHGDVPRKGLGLEIARSFAAALDGKLSLSPREGGGVRAQVELPAAVSIGISPMKSM